MFLATVAVKSTATSFTSMAENYLSRAHKQAPASKRKIAIVIGYIDPPTNHLRATAEVVGM